MEGCIPSCSLHSQALLLPALQTAYSKPQVERPEILTLLQNRSFWKREAQRRTVQHLLELGLDGDEWAIQTLEEASRLPTPQLDLIKQALAFLALTVESAPSHEAELGPPNPGKFHSHLKFEKLSCPSTLTTPDPQGLWSVDRAQRQIWRLTERKPGPLLHNCRPEADAFVCGSNFVIAYKDVPYQTTEVVPPTPRDYQIFGTDGQLLRTVAGSNQAEPAIGDDLVVLPGPQVALYWPRQDRLLILPYGSNASFSPRKDRLALCGNDITIVTTADGQEIARWPARPTNRRSGLGRVYAKWGLSHNFLCEFYELFEHRWEHCFRENDRVVRLHKENGFEMGTWMSDDAVSYALATSQGIFRALSSDLIEFVSNHNRVTRRWKASWPYANSPCIFELPCARFALTADNGGLWVVDENGQEQFACPPFSDSSFLSVAADPHWIAALDYAGKVCLWSAQNGRRLARLQAPQSSREVCLCGPYLYAGGSLWPRSLD